MPDRIIDIARWVDEVKSDPHRHLERQATEIILTAIGMAPKIRENIFLKGGVLMGVVHESPRQTADMDFTISLPPTATVDDEIRKIFDGNFPSAAARLGYPDLVVKVQTIEQKPKPKNFEEHDFPALKIRVAYAQRGTHQEQQLQEGKCANVIELDMSFNEPVKSIEIIKLGEHGENIRIYSLLELIAEKTRAQLQQITRKHNRNRPQDFYDIALLLRQYRLSEEEKKMLLEIFKEKCQSRGIQPDQNSLSNPKVIDSAKSQWHNLTLELGEVPSFEECYAEVEGFYRSLPW